MMAAACGGSSTASPKRGLNATTGDRVDVIASLTGQGTTITLDPATTRQLTKAGIRVLPFGAAQPSNGGSAITFPITSGYTEVHSDKSFKPGYVMGSIEHAGAGLTFAAGAKQVTAANFVVDPGNSMVYATVGPTNGVPLLALNDANLNASTQGSDVVLDGMVAQLTPTAATLLDRTLGPNALTPGLPLGSVHLVASGDLTSYNEATDRTTDIARVTGQTTSLKLDASTVQALTQLGIAVTPVGTSTYDSTTSTLSFPINGGVAVIHTNPSAKPGPVDGVLLHQGSGLRFSADGKSLTLLNFILDAGDSTLVAGVEGPQYMPVADLDDTSLHVSQVDGTVHLDGALVRLTPQAVQAMDRAFGRTAVTPGLLLGTAHIVLSGS